MKKLHSLLAVMLLAATAMMAQQPAPGILNYQGVARNSVGNVLINKNITLRLTIHDGTAAGPVVYQESRAVTTNPFGLFNVQLGSGGTISQTGTIAGVPWGVGLKYIQVEIDPNGGSSFINIGTAQLASVPYSLYSSLANDLVLPFNKTQADAGTLFKITNSNTSSSGATALEGLTNSTAANASAITGTVTSTSPGGFSVGVRGINNGNGGLGIGVWGSQNGSGWGVYGQTPSGLGVFGSTNSGYGVYGGANANGIGVYGISSTGNAGRFEITNNANTAAVLAVNSNNPGDGVQSLKTGTGGKAGYFENTNAANGSEVLQSVARGTNSAGSFVNLNAANAATTLTSSTVGTGGAGSFVVNNTAATGDALSASTNGGATSWALRATSTGAQGAGIFTYNNAAGTANALRVTNNGSGAAVSALSTGTGLTGDFQKTNAANTNFTVNIFDADVTTTGFNNGGVFAVKGGTAGAFVLTGQTAIKAVTSLGTGISINGGSGSGIGVAGVTNTGIALAGVAATPATGFGLVTIGRVQIQGNGAALNRVLTSDATGNATWQPLGAIGGVTGSGTVNFVPKWTPSTTNLGNSLIFDDGTSVAIGTTTPTHRFTVNHAGSTGIGINSSASFSVLDINAFSGDAAIRLANNGVNQWNIRNQPGNNNLQIFELGGGGERMHIEDGTGNISIGGAVDPLSYRLDILHGGSSGERIKSSASFSVLDIDAFSGDAAIRLANNGVNQWNLRNQPGTNNLQIFELGGGGERMHIEDGTGNISIGGAVDPLTHRLSILHGGSSGILNKSTASFSVIDIDAFSGDAAIRFANNGVNQWNLRNQPGTNNLQIFELGGGGERMHIEDATGNISIGGAVDPLTHRLSILHGGSSGILNKSTASFSVLDIDAFSGDAAIRLANNGVNQWNIRNQPGTDNLQIFELGGGGERMHIQDATGNVSIGGITPSYRLDVQHGGATGIRSKSTSSYSVIDIDSKNGDAALRFFKDGVGPANFRWVVRNDPSTDNFQIWGNNGATVFQEIDYASGNVGLNIVPTSYKLDVQHGGSSGIRSRSTSSYSVVDIDANNGDAALRFFKGGVAPANFRWVVRNDPSTDNFQIWGNNGATVFQDINYTSGKVTVYNDFTALGVKLFTMDHPLDPENKTLMHAAAESNEVINFYSGNITTDASGKAVVQLPDYFEAINKDPRYQLTVIGSFAQAIISKKVSNNQFEIATSLPNIEVSWEVKGVRNDARMQKHPFAAVQEKAASEKGKYLDPEAHNQPLTKGVNYNPAAETSLKAGYKPVETRVAAPVSGPSSLDPVADPKNVKQGDNTSGSVADTKPAEQKATTKPEEIKGTSLEDVKKPAEQKAAKPEEIKGTSVEDVKKPAEKKADSKPVQTKGTSLEDTPAPPKKEKKIESNVTQVTNEKPVQEVESKAAGVARTLEVVSDKSTPVKEEKAPIVTEQVKPVKSDK